MICPKTERDMGCLIESISAIRNMRAAWNIDPKLEVVAIINAHDKHNETLIRDNEEFIKRLSRLSALTVGRIAKPKNAAAAVVGKLEIYVPLEGVIDMEKERSRLKKEEERLSVEIRAISERLKDKNFTKKAPKEVVERQSARKAELELQVEKLKDNLKNVG
jgi:valyl-tRNA synthetase